MQTPLKHLMIGQMILTNEPMIISTVLGSCISVCLLCPEQNAGGIIHYALPTHVAQLKDPHHLRYGDYAINKLVEELKQLTHLTENSFEAKIVGGAWAADPKADIGQENIQMAHQELKRLGIKIVSKDVGGKLGRKILYHIPSGRLQVATL
jgi:chemotaxis protein CheD